MHTASTGASQKQTPVNHYYTGPWKHLELYFLPLEKLKSNKEKTKDRKKFYKMATSMTYKEAAQKLSSFNLVPKSY